MGAEAECCIELGELGESIMSDIGGTGGTGGTFIFNPLTGDILYESALIPKEGESELDMYKRMLKDLTIKLERTQRELERTQRELESVTRELQNYIDNDIQPV